MKKCFGIFLILTVMLFLLAGCGEQTPEMVTVPDSDLSLSNVTKHGCDVYRKDDLVGGILEVAMEPDEVSVHGMEDTQWFQLVKGPMAGMVSGDYDFFSGSGLYRDTVTLTFYHPDLGEYSHYIFTWGDQVFDLWTRPDHLTDGEEEQIMAFIMEYRP